MGKVVGKSCGYNYRYDFNNIVWKYLSDYEPLILFVVLLFNSCAPWKPKKAKYVKRCEGNLQKVWKNNFSLERNLLRKILDTPRALEIMLGSMVQEVLQGGTG